MNLMALTQIKLVLALAATLAIYKSDFPESITNYENILKNDSKSFDGNLGIAMPHKFYETSKAYNAALTTLRSLKPGRCNEFYQKLKEDFIPLSKKIKLYI
jgi:hypothetical protein